MVIKKPPCFLPRWPTPCAPGSGTTLSPLPGAFFAQLADTGGEEPTDEATCQREHSSSALRLLREMTDDELLERESRRRELLRRVPGDPHSALADREGNRQRT